jgi:hypothetical protein
MLLSELSVFSQKAIVIPGGANGFPDELRAEIDRATHREPRTLLQFDQAYRYIRHH